MNVKRWSTAVLAAGLTMTGVLAAAPAGQAAQIGAFRRHSPAAGATGPQLARFYAQHARWHR
ncbi:MAG: hypothetical protein ACTHKL_28310, partial [Streptosporangiaceae bacterium]